MIVVPAPPGSIVVVYTDDGAADQVSLPICAVILGGDGHLTTAVTTGGSTQTVAAGVAFVRWGDIG